MTRCSSLSQLITQTAAFLLLHTSQHNLRFDSPFQEPGTNPEIKEFATSTHGVTFDMYSKIDVNGASADPLYKFLKKEQHGFITECVFFFLHSFELRFLLRIILDVAYVGVSWLQALGRHTWIVVCNWLIILHRSSQTINFCFVLMFAFSDLDIIHCIFHRWLT